ncbi:MAG: hypothetical protein H7Y27_09615, partial [Gemmatimonadaceae bacterium]|nr:hypothetical protein [Chitinophagaceae bacterium]
FDAVSFSNTQRTFTVKKVHIKPVLGEAAFVKQARLQTDRFDFIFNDVSIKNINLDKLMDESFYADSLIVRDANVKIFRDLSYPRDKVDRRGGYPQQMLMKMDLPVAIKKLIIRSAFIEYKEFNPKSDYNGRVQFQRASASISNVTNIKSEIAQNNNLLINFNAHFLNFAPMHATINMKLGDPRGRFTASGGMSKFDATRLNVLLKPAALAQVDKGTVNKLTFSLNADDNNSNGQLVMLYEDLKLTILKKDSAENKLQKKKFASFLGNMVIKNANPSGRKDPRKATIQYQRDPNRSFFNLIWKSIFVGVKESVGVPSN